MPPRTGPLRLSLVIPCYNEEASIERLYDAVSRTIAAVGDDVEPEIVFVDDGSDDGTLRVLRHLAAGHPEVRYTSLSRNFGKEAAMLAGLERATGDAVVIMDADLQHPPELLRTMIELHRQGFDQVIARRDRRGDKLVRTLASRAFYRLVNAWVDVELVDGAGDFRLLSRRAVEALLSLPEYNRFSKGLYAWIGFNTATFTYANEARQAGKSRWTIGKLFNYALDGMLSFNNRPLRGAVYMGLLLTTVAVGYMIWVIGMAVVHGIDAPGYVTIIASVIGLGGIQMTTLGVIGEYVGRIYYETKRRPHYLIRETEVPLTRDVGVAGQRARESGEDVAGLSTRRLR
ncbi:glycosyltransferase family 2 protein [Micromonospora zhanjiangensis]|uniref:Glycosyltransferase family 2 protein n=1 Tax=Micromonospora zhanjiangensis TaxID=1522057 RepID=A0ABV8KGN2_9ACTN